MFQFQWHSVTSPQRYQVPLEKHRRSRTGRSWGSLIKTGPKLQRHRQGLARGFAMEADEIFTGSFTVSADKKVSSCIVFEVIVREVGVARSWNSLKQRTCRVLRKDRQVIFPVVQMWLFIAGKIATGRCTCTFHANEEDALGFVAFVASKCRKVAGGSAQGERLGDVKMPWSSTKAFQRWSPAKKSLISGGCWWISPS